MWNANFMTSERETKLDAIIRIESCLIELELHMAKRQAPFDGAERRIFDRMSRILAMARESYLKT